MSVVFGWFFFSFVWGFLLFFDGGASFERVIGVAVSKSMKYEQQLWRATYNS